MFVFDVSCADEVRHALR
ncbi:hypothetical protein CP8484711_0507A, partial [Chlamydia psittaci 84-8471/1]